MNSIISIERIHIPKQLGFAGCLPSRKHFLLRNGQRVETSKPNLFPLRMLNDRFNIIRHLSKSHSLISNTLCLQRFAKLLVEWVKLLDEIQVLLLKFRCLKLFRVPLFNAFNGIELRKNIFRINQIQVKLIDI